MRDRINARLKEAMRAKDTLRLSALRLISAAIKDRDIAARGEGRDGGIPEDEILALLAKMITQRNESARTYDEAGRVELAEKERAEIAVIEEFLPRRLDEAETEAAVKAAIAELGAASVRDMGRVMGALKAKYPGQMDFAHAGSVAKGMLG